LILRNGNTQATPRRIPTARHRRQKRGLIWTEPHYLFPSTKARTTWQDPDSQTQIAKPRQPDPGGQNLIRFFTILAALIAVPVWAAQRFVFDDIDGGTLSMDDWQGQPVLVVNTASRCGFTKQYDGLQALYDRYRDQGLVVLAVPSNDFRQELSSAEDVKDFCEVNFGLDIPMTDITPVRGPQAHPFYRWLAAQNGFEPAWNFNKVLIGGDGTVRATFGSTTRPLSRKMIRAVEASLE
jgi:glutathione peroxidase